MDKMHRTHDCAHNTTKVRAEEGVGRGGGSGEGWRAPYLRNAEFSGALSHRGGLRLDQGHRSSDVINKGINGWFVMVVDDS